MWPDGIFGFILDIISSCKTTILQLPFTENVWAPNSTPSIFSSIINFFCFEKLKLFLNSLGRTDFLLRSKIPRLPEELQVLIKSFYHLIIFY